jgi:hypothetical protein
VGQVGHKILYGFQVGQRIDAYILRCFVDALDACQGIGAVDIHGAGTADTLPVGPAKGQRLVDLVLDLDERVKHP